jgi:apolipoprotein N-acyltransferase
MASEIREWSVPAPARALLWWPAISFVLVVVAPDAATGVIILAGAVLALVGAALPVLARRLRPRSGEPPTMEFPTMEMPPAQGDRAA